ncbi:MAG TPA: hypothetical protein VGF67_01440 [Ktedonobacteraceae bacterium]|jgi:hypothetical protein
MRTKEEGKRECFALAEQAVEGLLGQMEKVEEGDRDHVEQAVDHTFVELGRRGMEKLLQQKASEPEQPDPAEKSGGHPLRLVRSREKLILILRGSITIRRASDHCPERKQREGTSSRLAPCPGVVPFDQRWGLGRQENSSGAQRLVACVSARSPHEEVAEAVARVLPLTISARQIGHVIQPRGEAFLQQEDRRVQQILEQGTHQHRSHTQQQEEQRESMGRLSVERDGVMARLRRGSVPMEQGE